VKLTKKVGIVLIVIWILDGIKAQSMGMVITEVLRKSLHSSFMLFLRERLTLARGAPQSDFRDGAIEELEEMLEWIENEAYVEDWNDTES
jgi:hypothetical protein